MCHKLKLLYFIRIKYRSIMVHEHKKIDIREKCKNATDNGAQYNF